MSSDIKRRTITNIYNIGEHMDNKKFNRRDFMKISSAFGLRAAIGTSALAAAGAVMPGKNFFMKEAKAVEKAKYRIRFGAGIASPIVENYMPTAIYDFVEYVENHTDGEVKFQVIDSSGSCAENTCGDQVASGIIDMGMSSPQNLGSVFPYAIAMDFPFLWKDRDAYLSFLSSPDSNRPYRDVLRKAYGIEPLFAVGEMRDIFLGLKYKDEAAIRTQEDFINAKFRITNSMMIANFINSLGGNPIPLAWAETLEGLRSGVVDGCETWAGAAASSGLHRVLSHHIPLQFSPGYELTFMRSSKFQELPERIQEVFYRGAKEAMDIGYKKVDIAQNLTVGNGPQPDAESAFSEAGVQRAILSTEELEEFKSISAVEVNSEIYDSITKQLSAVAGFNVYEEMLESAKKYNGIQYQSGEWWS